MDTTTTFLRNHAALATDKCSCGREHDGASVQVDVVLTCKAVHPGSQVRCDLPPHVSGKHHASVRCAHGAVVGGSIKVW